MGFVQALWSDSEVTTMSKNIPVKAVGRKMGFCVSVCVQ